MRDHSESRSPIYTKHDLRVFNLLAEPIWVFDVEKRAMWWANKAALDLWNADTLDNLLKRNFSDDMSETTANRLAEYMKEFASNETVTEQVWYCCNAQPGSRVLARESVLTMRCWCFSSSTVLFLFLVICDEVDILSERKGSNNRGCSIIWNQGGERENRHAKRRENRTQGRN